MEGHPLGLKPNQKAVVESIIIIKEDLLETPKAGVGMARCSCPQEGAIRPMPLFEESTFATAHRNVCLKPFLQNPDDDYDHSDDNNKNIDSTSLKPFSRIGTFSIDYDEDDESVTKADGLSIGKEKKLIETYCRSVFRTTTLNDNEEDGVHKRYSAPEEEPNINGIGKQPPKNSLFQLLFLVSVKQGMPEVISVFGAHRFHLLSAF